jgi:hypothetical protein
MDNDRNKEQKDVTELEDANANTEATELEDKALEDASGGQITNGNCGC